MLVSVSAFSWSVVAGLVTVFGTFSFQHWLIKVFDPLIVSMAFQSEPLFSLILVTVLHIQGLEGVSMIMYALLLILPNMLIVGGIRQFEDKYEGGIVGMTPKERNAIRSNHYQELELLGVGELSETHSRQK